MSVHRKSDEKGGEITCVRIGFICTYNTRFATTRPCISLPLSLSLSFSVLSRCDKLAFEDLLFLFFSHKTHFGRIQNDTAWNNAYVSYQPFVGRAPKKKKKTKSGLAAYMSHTPCYNNVNLMQVIRLSLVEIRGGSIPQPPALPVFG